MFSMWSKKDKPHRTHRKIFSLANLIIMDSMMNLNYAIIEILRYAQNDNQAYVCYVPMWSKNK
jgi:hypothetical protein